MKTAVSLRVKPGCIVPESGCYRGSISNFKIALKKGNCAPIPPEKNEYWELIFEKHPYDYFNPCPFSHMTNDR